MKAETKKPLLSVIVPVTRMAGKLNQLTSWMLKTLNFSIQVIIVHDVSDLKTGVELKEIIKSNNLSNVIFIEGRYGSPGVARNAGIDVAIGDWYVFWDSDDTPMVENVIAAIMKTSSDDEIVIGKFSVRNHRDSSLRENYNEFLSVNSIAMNPGIWRMIFRSKIIHTTRFTNLRSGEDQVFLSQINLVEKKLKFHSEIFYEYGTEQDSQLTNSIQNLRDLPNASRIIHKKAIQSKGNVLLFDLILIIRQQITLLKRGSTRLRFRTLCFFLLYTKYFRAFMLVPTLKAIFFVITNLRKSQIR